MERVKPNNESLDTYIGLIEQGLMMLGDYREQNGVKNSTKKFLMLGDSLKESYLRMFNYNSALINMNNIDDCLVDVCKDDQKPKIEVDMELAESFATKVSYAIKKLFSVTKETRAFRTNLAYYRVGLHNKGNYIFTPSETTLASVIYRTANCVLFDEVSNGFFEKAKHLYNSSYYTVVINALGMIPMWKDILNRGNKTESVPETEPEPIKLENVITNLLIAEHKYDSVAENSRIPERWDLRKSVKNSYNKTVDIQDIYVLFGQPTNKENPTNVRKGDKFNNSRKFNLSAGNLFGNNSISELALEHADMKRNNTNSMLYLDLNVMQEYVNVLQEQLVPCVESQMPVDDKTFKLTPKNKITGVSAGEVYTRLHSVNEGLKAYAIQEGLESANGTFKPLIKNFDELDISRAVFDYLNVIDKEAEVEASNKPYYGHRSGKLTQTTPDKTVFNRPKNTKHDLAQVAFKKFAGDKLITQGLKEQFYEQFNTGLIKIKGWNRAI